MNRFFTCIFNEVRSGNRPLLFLFDAIIAILSILLFSGKLISLLFSVGILFIDFIYCFVQFLLRDDHFKVERLVIDKIKIIFFLFLFIFGFFPLLIGTIVEKGVFFRILLKNTVPNILGAFTVYCIAKHLSVIEYNYFVVKILKTDYRFNFVIKVCYCFCFFNSATYFFDENLKYANWVNNIYLFMVIITGLLVGYALFYRIFVDNKPFDFSPKKVYPSKPLICGAAYLASCSLPSLCIDVRIEPISLVLNTLTGFIVGFSFLCFVIRKGNNKFNEYPFGEFFVFFLMIVLSCSVYIIYNVGDFGDILNQFSTSGSILIAVSILIYILNKRAKNVAAKDEKDEDEQ